MNTRSRNNPVKRKLGSVKENETDESPFDKESCDESDSDYDDLYSDEDINKTNSRNNKKGVKQSVNKESFDKITKEIKRTEPNIRLLINEPLLLQDKAKLLQLYEIYKSSEINTENWLNLRNNINIIFEEAKNNYIKHNKYTTKEHEEMKKQLLLLDNYNSDSNFKYKILELKTHIENKQIIYNKYKELNSISPTDDERGKLKHWLNWAVSLPYDSIKTFPLLGSELTNFLRNILITLDQELYGMKHVKEQILLFVSSKIQNPHMKKCSLGFIGPPGVGKTYISRLLAKILNFPFEQISLGGISNSDFLKGHEYTYIGSQPGEIVKCLKRMKYKNGILFLDEFDKISNNTDICSALLHITDPVQNSDFKDNFLNGITVDLSYIWFIYSMNKLPSDSALSDRIYTIEVPGYTEKDKICIVSDYIFPRALKNININYNKDFIIITSDVAKHLVNKTNGTNNELDHGIRKLEKTVHDIVTKIDFIIKHQDKQGNLVGFDISFKLGKFIKYPITLTSDMIDILIGSN
jgi:ATP-dependent Lon protease